MISNKRRTTKGRDFILAIMPQFMFYRVPADAKEMTFSALFFDCIRQLSDIGHSLAPLITNRTINLIKSESRIYKTEIPEPESLGDFIKLINGPRIGYPPHTMVPLYSAQTRPVVDLADFQHIVGTNPDADTLKVAHALMTIHLVVRQMSIAQETFKQANADLMHESRAPLEERPLCFIDAVQNLICIARLFEQGLSAQDIAAYNDYALLSYLRSEVDRKALLILAGMVACNIGLSAFEWVQEHLQPLRIDLPYQSSKLSAIALVKRGMSLEQRFFMTDGGEFSFHMGGAYKFKRWALFATEKLESGELEMCLFPLEVRFKRNDDGYDYVPGKVGMMAAIE